MYYDYISSWTPGTAEALHCLRIGDELIERLAPALAEAHPVVRVTALLVLVQGKRDVFRPLSVRLERDDRGEGRDVEGGIGWPIAGLERHRPYELAVRHDLEEAADIGYVLTFRRAHDGAEDAAGVDCAPGAGPFEGSDLTG